MSKITRNQFIAQFKDGHINLNEMSKELEDAFKKVNITGIDGMDLKKIARSDAQISGDEWGKLFDKVNEGDPGPLDLEEHVIGSAAPLVNELRKEVERNRAAAKTQGIIHLGMTGDSTKEVKVLEGVTPKQQGGVYSIRDAPLQDSVEYGGKSYALDSDPGRQAFAAALVKDGMPGKAASNLKDLLATANHETRDETAQLALALFNAGTGKLPVNRLVLSGHGLGDGIAREARTPALTFEVIAKLASVFPQGAAKINHVMVAACSCGHPAQVAELRAMFPNLKSVWAYPGFSPKAITATAQEDMKTWAEATSGKDPSMVDPPKRSVQAARTWNVVDGYANMPVRGLGQVREDVKGDEANVEQYRKNPPTKPPHDFLLDTHYARLVELEFHPDLPPAEKKLVHDRRMEVFSYRYPM
jgi:hypothetical protein